MNWKFDLLELLLFFTVINILCFLKIKPDYLLFCFFVLQVLLKDIKKNQLYYIKNYLNWSINIVQVFWQAVEKLKTVDIITLFCTFRWQRWMEWDGTDMCWGGMMGEFWEKHWNLMWRARGSEDDQKRHGRCKWRRRARVLVWRRRMPWMKQDGEWWEIAVRVG